MEEEEEPVEVCLLSTLNTIFTILNVFLLTKGRPFLLEFKFH